MKVPFVILMLKLPKTVSINENSKTALLAAELSVKVRFALSVATNLDELGIGTADQCPVAGSIRIVAGRKTAGERTDLAINIAFTSNLAGIGWRGSGDSRQAGKGLYPADGLRVRQVNEVLSSTSGAALINRQRAGEVGRDDCRTGSSSA